MSNFRMTVLVALVISAIGVTAIGNAVAGEKFKLRTVKYATKWEQIEIGDVEKHVINLNDAVGIVTNMEGKAFGDGWPMRHIGLGDGSPKGAVASGYEEVTDKDGDKY